MFSLCQLSDSIQAYCMWLADEQSTSTCGACCICWEDWLNIFDMRHMTSTTNIKFVARVSTAIFVGFAISYVGYGHIIIAKDATIPSKIAVLMSNSIYWPSAHPATVPALWVRGLLSVRWDRVVGLSAASGRQF